MTYKTNWLGGILAPLLIMSPVAHAIQTNLTGSGAHSVFIDNGAVFAMGSNNYGEIMPGAGGEFRTPLSMSILDAATVAASQQRIAVLKKDGTAVVHGLNFSTYAGNMDNPFPTTGISDIALSLKNVFYVKSGELFMWNGEAVGVPVSLATNVKSVAAGNFHAVILFNDGTVGTYGKNTNGQLGTGDIVDSTAVVKLPLTGVEEIAASANNSYAKLMGRSVVYGWGSNSGYQLGVADVSNKLVPTQLATPANVFKMVGGQSYMALMTGDGSVYSSGWHDYIGGSLYNVSTGFVKMPIAQVDDIGGGNDQIMVRLTGTIDKISGWGGNVYGKLGDGTNTERHYLTDAFFTPIAPPVVAPPVVAVVEPVVVTPVPEVTELAGANPLQEQTPAVIMPPNEVTVTDIIVNTIVDVVNAIVSTVEDVVDTIINAVTPSHHQDVVHKEHDNNKDGAKHDNVLGHQNSSDKVVVSDDKNKRCDKKDDKKDDKKVEVAKKDDKKDKDCSDKKDDKKVEVAKKDDKKDGKKS